MATVYIYFHAESGEGFQVPLETLILIFVAQWRKPNFTDTGCSSNSIEVKIVSENPIFDFVFVKTPASDDAASFELPKEALDTFTISVINEDCLKTAIQKCILPAIQTCGDQLCIAGLGSVLRYLLKNSSEEKCQKLLGFRKGCLVGCAEFSVWTKFCEVELLNCAKQFVKCHSTQSTDAIPVHISRFEAHLNEPIRTHNIGKKKYDVAKQLQKENSLRKPLKTDLHKPEATVGHANEKRHNNKLPKDTKALPNLPHTYAEEMAMTLADLIIYVCIAHILYRLPSNWDHLRSILPAVTKWYLLLLENPDVVHASKTCAIPDASLRRTCDRVSITATVVSKHSLYLRDPKRYNSRQRMYTKQTDVAAVISKLKGLQITPMYDSRPQFPTDALDWSEFPEVVLPTFGELPQSRSVRKCQQLENMALTVCSLAVDGDVIVDFCSGGGHLGILLAHLLPKCQIILVENKEESVNRAFVRARMFPNTSIYQCNLDYFRGEFNIGVGLHACGMATDLIIQCCLKVRASFVVCPCCYGGLQNTHLVTYPRSKPFQEAALSLEEYYVLGHAADQTHENGHKNDQGKYCMGLVDTDRGLQAISLGYKVALYTMNPVTCTPKNNIILGMTAERHRILEPDWL